MSAIPREAPASIVPTVDRPLPPSLLRIVDRRLEKSPGARFQSTTDLGVRVEERLAVPDAVARAGSETATLPVPAEGARMAANCCSSRWGRCSSISLAHHLAVPLASRGSRPPGPEIVRFAIGAPAGTQFDLQPIAPWPAISPDGEHLAFGAVREVQENPLASPPCAAPMPGRLGSRLISRLLVVLVSRRPIARVLERFKLQRLDLSTNVVQTICESDGLNSRRGVGAERRHCHVARGGPTGSGPLMQVQATGGTPKPLTTLGRRGQADHSPKPIVSARPAGDSSINPCPDESSG